MKYISGKDINLGVALVILSSITFVGGFSKWPLFIIAAISIISYVILDRKKLRCPTCGGFENLERLIAAKKHSFHCRHCGERLNILD